MDTRNEHAVEHDRATDRAMYSEQSVPSSEVRRRRSLYPMRNERSKRLSAARDDLDDALQAAIGGTSVASSRSEQDIYLASDDVGAGANGELTSANEDFTMITGASLASISFKANGTMLGDAAHDEEEGEEVKADHLTSSPPQEAMYPDISGQVDETKTPMLDNNPDAMNWEHTRNSEPKRLQYHDMEMNEDISISIEHGSEPQNAIVVDEVDATSRNSSPTSDTHSYQSPHEIQDSTTTPVVDNEATIGASNPDDGGKDEDENETSDAHMAKARAVEMEEAEDDIWAEEASRDIDDSAITTASTRSQVPQRSRNTNNQPTGTTTSVPLISSEQPDPSRRAKLPRTWRQISGAEFSYADSRAQSREPGDDTTEQFQTIPEQSEARPAQRTSGEEDESGRHSGVLTPSSTDDNDSRRKLHDVSAKEQGDRSDQPLGEAPAEEVDVEDQEMSYRDDEEEEDISGFTNPGAADTQLEAHHGFGRQDASVDEKEEEEQEEEIARPLSEPGSDVSAPGEDGEDTGFFWQSNLPQVYRSNKEKPKPQRKPVDLSAILRMDSSKVEEGESSQRSSPTLNPAPARTQPNKPMFSVRRKRHVVAPRANRADGLSDNVYGHILPSPVRRSLLRSSKVIDGNEPLQPPVVRKPTQTVPEATIEETQVTITDDSLASKASDQQQLLSEIRATTPVAKKPAHERLAVLRDLSQPSQVNGRAEEISYEETDTTFKNSWLEHSYEENLNIESPQKINVNFNDSTLSFRNEQQQQQLRANLLVPRGPIKSLFEKSTNAAFSKPSVSANEKQSLSQGPPAITLVGAPKPKPSPTLQENEGIFARLNTSFWSAVARPRGPPPTPAPHNRTTEQTIKLSLRAQLRSRYGILPNSHPWTMAHMRTLHRMLNSLESGRRDSIVPTHPPLPPHLTEIVGKGCLSATGRSFRFEQTHACVVQAFLQILVTPSLFQSMERGEVEWLGDAQAAHLRGEMGGRLGSDLCFKTLKPGRGLITWEWVVECLGCCVISNVETGMRRVGVNVRREKPVRDVELSIMGDGEGEGRVRDWFERDGGMVAI
jgi:hypothetical protein